jgi:hypothetical protein
VFSQPSVTDTLEKHTLVVTFKRKDQVPLHNAGEDSPYTMQTKDQ